MIGTLQVDRQKLQNPIPSPDDNAYINACVKQEPTPPNSAFCLPA
jgi:hypothetical protein